MIARIVILIMALTATAMAQGVLLPGFPPGLFMNRGALDGTAVIVLAGNSACLLRSGIVLPCQDPLANTPTLIGGF
jgi:hypothetical protein